jgi:hypothetical protein
MLRRRRGRGEVAAMRAATANVGYSLDCLDNGLGKESWIGDRSSTKPVLVVIFYASDPDTPFCDVIG